MNELVFLPDRTGRDVLTDAVGFVRLGADGAPLEVLSRRVVTRDAGVDRDAEEIRWRAVLALTLMCDIWLDLPDGPDGRGMRPEAAGHARGPDDGCAAPGGVD